MKSIKLFLILVFLIASNVYALCPSPDDYNKYDKFISGVDAEKSIQKITQNIPKYKIEELFLVNTETGVKIPFKRMEPIIRDVGGKSEPATLLITKDNTLILLPKDGIPKSLKISQQEIQHYQVGLKDGGQLSDIIERKFAKDGIQVVTLTPDKYIGGVRITKISIAKKTIRGKPVDLKDYIFILDKGKLYIYTLDTLKDPRIIDLLKGVGIVK